MKGCLSWAKEQDLRMPQVVTVSTREKGLPQVGLGEENVFPKGWDTSQVHRQRTKASQLLSGFKK